MRKHRVRKPEKKNLEAIRIRAVRRVLKGENAGVVIRSLGFSRGCIYEWLKKFRLGGWAALNSQQISGRPHRLTASQQAWIRERLTESSPLELGFRSALWTRALVATFIRNQFGIQLSRASVGRLLHEFGLSSQHPWRRAREINPAALASWQRKEYAQIRLLARDARAEIVFLDVTRASRPLLAAKSETSLLSAFSPNGQIQFMLAKGSLTSESLALFLHALMHGRTRPLFVIAPQGLLQREVAVENCVVSFAGRLRLFAMPLPPTETNQPRTGPTRIVNAEPWSEPSLVNVPLVPVAPPATLWTNIAGLGGVSP
jgi:transposase